MKAQETFTIRQMIELTGLSEFTLRGWEGRYAAFGPKRGETGRRSYSKLDLEKAILLRELTQRGHKISQLSSLKLEQLKELFTHSSQADLTHSKEESPLVAKAIDLLSLQSWEKLEQCLKKAKFASSSDLISKFILPCLYRLGKLSDSSYISIAQEHVFSSLIKEKIYAELTNLKFKKRTKSKKFVLATPEGDHHDLGLLIAQLLIRSHGHTCIYLGAHTPCRDLAETFLRTESTHILIAATVSESEGAKQSLYSYLSSVMNKVGDKAQILVAGKQCPLVGAHAGWKTLPSFQSLQSYLEDIS